MSKIFNLRQRRHVRPWKPTRRDRRVLLVLLTGAGNLSGYPISRAAQVGSGQVYVSLARLEREGWVDSDWGDGPPGRRRRYYRLTPTGRVRALASLGLAESSVTVSTTGGA
jgi:DNA-binding PadR family transcriptional regulator